MEVNISNKQAAQLKADYRALGEQTGCAHLSVMSLEAIAHRGGHDFVPYRSAVGDAERLHGLCRDTLSRLGDGLAALGVFSSAPDLTSPSTVDGNELASLSTIGGDDLRELLGLLEAAQSVAERIDAARGFTVGDSIPLQPGESRGTDLAESVSLLALRVRQEARGGVSPHE